MKLKIAASTMVTGFLLLVSSLASANQVVWRCQQSQMFPDMTHAEVIRVGTSLKLRMHYFSGIDFSKEFSARDVTQEKKRSTGIEQIIEAPGMQLVISKVGARDFNGKSGFAAKFTSTNHLFPSAAMVCIK